MHRRSALLIIALLVFTALLAACGGSAATDTPKAAAPTTAAPTTAPPGAAACIAAAATRPAGSAATGSSVAATTAPTTAPTAASGSASAAAVTRPPSAAAPTTAAGSASAVSGTRPAGSATTGSVTAGSTIAAGSATAGAALTPFADPKGRFSFSRPSAWTVGQPTSATSVVQFSSTNPLGVVDVSTESVAGSVTPEKYLEAALAEIKKDIPDAQQIGTTTLQLDAEPATQIDYTGSVNGSKIYFSQIFALHKGTAYVLTLGTQPADIEKMKQQAIPIIQTWKFLQ